MTNSSAFQFLPNANLTEADILILPVPIENTVSYKSGTSLAPQAILRASEQLEYYEEEEAWSPLLHMNIHVLNTFSPKSDEDEHTLHQRLYKTVTALPQENLFIALGGEHSITPDIVAARMPKPGTVIQLDAHADLREQFNGSPYNHACPMHRIREQHHQLIMLGIRSLTEKEAQQIAHDEKITAYMDHQLRHTKAWPPLLRKLGRITGDVWLTIDMDAFNPCLVPGVGTPQPGGMSWHQAIDILKAIVCNPNINFRGLDIVELTPEPTHVSEITAAKLVQKAISFWGKAHNYDQKPKTGSQSHVDDF